MPSSLKSFTIPKKKKETSASQSKISNESQSSVPKDSKFSLALNEINTIAKPSMPCRISFALLSKTLQKSLAVTPHQVNKEYTKPKKGERQKKTEE